MNAAVTVMTNVSATAVELSQHAHTASWIGRSGKSDAYLVDQIDRDFQRLADLLGYEVTERPKAIQHHQTNTEPSRRALSAEDRADTEYQQGREEFA